VNTDAEIIRRLYGRYDPARGVTANDQARDAAMAHLAALDSQVIAPWRDRPRTRRHARSRARIRGTLVGGTAALIAGGALFASTATGAPSALAAVSSAVAKTSAASFRVSLAVTERNGGPGSPTPSAPFRVTGEFDPTRHLGEETITNGWQMRFIGGHAYMRSHSLGGKPWYEQPILSSGLAASDLAWDYNSDRPINPSALLGLLKSAGTIRDEGPVSGPGWTGTKYGFTVRNPVSIVESISGTVYVDSEGRLRQLVQLVTFAPESTAASKPAGPAEILTLDFTFSDFGARVPVAAPPASQVDDGRGGIIMGAQF
jgi:hypothetical protein